MRPVIRPMASSKVTDTSLAIDLATRKPSGDPLFVQVEFEVIGEIQGTYFLKYTRDMCDKLGLRGWVRLSRRSTVIGQLQGDKERVDEMALWLRLQGAPGSRIEHTEFRNWQIIDRVEFKSFSIRF